MWEESLSMRHLPIKILFPFFLARWESGCPGSIGLWELRGVWLSSGDLVSYPWVATNVPRVLGSLALCFPRLESGEWGDNRGLRESDLESVGDVVRGPHGG